MGDEENKKNSINLISRRGNAKYELKINGFFKSKQQKLNAKKPKRNFNYLRKKQEGEKAMKEMQQQLENNARWV